MTQLLITVLIILSLHITQSYHIKSSNKLSNRLSTKLFVNFPFLSSKKQEKAIVRDTIIVPPDYKVAGGFAATSLLLFAVQNDYTAIAFGLIALLLFVQTGRVRFVFDNDSLEVLIEKKDNDKQLLEKSADNFAVGGRNRWAYNTFTEWFFIPNRNLPILMYFKETQTSPKGQIHFFPVIMDSKVLNDVMVERIGNK
mmetsp:Transcript_17795/g.16068  ORF Transcript_17795/g.16068 Transcript_17795/m.16068 type:complete len:197 (-) Transcript_17795:104-694(-)